MKMLLYQFYLAVVFLIVLVTTIITIDLFFASWSGDMEKPERVFFFCCLLFGLPYLLAQILHIDNHVSDLRHTRTEPETTYHLLEGYRKFTIFHLVSMILYGLGSLVYLFPSQPEYTYLPVRPNKGCILMEYKPETLDMLATPMFFVLLVTIIYYIILRIRISRMR